MLWKGDILRAVKQLSGLFARQPVMAGKRAAKAALCPGIRKKDARRAG